ncbi:globin C, coelomic-like [Diadema antillarum]|uniref:globin C, coelomic-like n=1 Tax=Diadema antillarum TaxID=105358 RepID=UPI003A898CCB
MSTVPGGSFLKQAWAAITSFFGSFLSGDDDTPDENTGLTKQQKNLIQKSWNLVLEDKLNVGIALFINLFKAYPSSQDMFEKLRDITDFNELARNKKMKAHALRVMAAFNSMVENIDQPDILDELLRNTANTHYKLRMPAHYFEDLGGVLLDTLGNHFGDKFTPKMREAWTTFYTYMTRILLEEMEEMDPTKDDAL